MRKRMLAVAAALGLGLLLLLSLPSREAQAPSGDTPAVSSGPPPPRPVARLERPEDLEVRGTAETGGTPPLAHPATEAEGVLLVEVFAKERPVSRACPRASTRCSSSARRRPASTARWCWRRARRSSWATSRSGLPPPERKTRGAEDKRRGTRREGSAPSSCRARYRVPGAYCL